jgi:hypothetical protein
VQGKTLAAKLRNILEGESQPERSLPFADELSQHPERSAKRYGVIYWKACEELNSPEIFAVVERGFSSSEELSAYEAGKITDYDLFQKAKEKVGCILNCIAKC